MNKIVLKVVAISTASMMVLTGCDTTMADKMVHIGENFNKIASQFTPEKTAELVKDIESASLAAEEVSEVYNEEIVEVMDEASNDDMYSEEYADDEIGIDASTLSIGMLLLKDYLLREGPAIVEELKLYENEGIQTILEAIRMKDDGIAMIRDGADKFNKAVTTTDSNIKTDVLVDDTFDGAQMVIDGANEVATSATIVLDESIKWSEELIDIAEEFGVKSKELDSLKEQLEATKGTKIVLVSEKTSDDLNEYRKQLKDKLPDDVNIAEALDNLEGVDIEITIAVEDTFVEASEVIHKANEAAKVAVAVYEQANKAAQDMIAAAKQYGISSAEIELIESYLKEYEDISDNVKFLSDADIEIIAKGINKAIDNIGVIEIDDVFSLLR